MADETQTVEEQEFQAWVQGLSGEEEDDPTEELPGDDVVSELAAKVARMERSQQVDELTESFKAGASPAAVELFETVSDGVDDPEQLKRLIAWSVDKAKRVDRPITEQAEAKAAQLAKDAYGVGPLANSGPVGEPTPQEVFDRMREEARKTGDSHASFLLFNSLPADGGVSSAE